MCGAWNEYEGERVSGSCVRDRETKGGEGDERWGLLEYLLV